MCKKYESIINEFHTIFIIKLWDTKFWYKKIYVFFSKIEKNSMKIIAWTSLESSYINMCASWFLWKFIKDKIYAKFHEIKKKLQKKERKNRQH